MKNKTKIALFGLAALVANGCANLGNRVCNVPNMKYTITVPKSKSSSADYSYMFHRNSVLNTMAKRQGRTLEEMYKKVDTNGDYNIDLREYKTATIGIDPLLDNTAKYK